MSDAMTGLNWTGGGQIEIKSFRISARPKCAMRGAVTNIKYMTSLISRMHI